MTSADSQSRLENAVAHAMAAYQYAVSCLPTEPMFMHGRSVQIGEFEFRRYAQARSMLLELGWAFFVRIEAALEAHAGRIGFKRPSDVLGVIADDPELMNGYAIAREIRNTLHHGDGDATQLHTTPRFLTTDGQSEPHLLPDHLGRFAKLFIDVGERLVRAREAL